ncbi:uncharacterized protein LOC119385869 [Rhipicephalus sanguineus]|uniref:uncharacterized protein LOC119385869 n=1 Tax=Rhipicephalus sanguineus TaxID=34632 RepID=UPI0020C4F62F|nr:uncharacterized protein LOC119385869 [Rhipicephalus sanguineus]
MATSLPSAPYLFGSKSVSTATPAVPFGSALAVSTASVVSDLPTASSFSTPKLGLAPSVTSTTDTKRTSTEDLPLPSSSASTVMATSWSSEPFFLGSKTVSTATPAVSFGSAVTVSTASEVTELPLPTSSFSSSKKGLASSVRSTTDTKGTSKDDLPLPSSSASTVMATSWSSEPFLLGSKTVSTATPAVSFVSAQAVSTASEVTELPVPTRSFNNPEMGLASSVRPTRDTKGTSTEDLLLSSSSAATVMATSLPSVPYLFGSKRVSTTTPAVPFVSAVAVSTASVVSDLPTATSSFSAPEMGLAPSVRPTTDTKATSTEDMPLPSSSASTVMATSWPSAPFMLGSKTVFTGTTAVSFGSAVAVTTASEVTELPVPTQSFNNIEMGLASAVKPTRDTKKTSTEDLPLRSSSAETAMATSLPSAPYLFGSKSVSTATPAVPFRSAGAVTTASEVTELPVPTSSFSTSKMGLASSVRSSTHTKGTFTEDLPLPSSSAATAMATSQSSATLFGSETVSTATPAVSFGSALPVSTASEVTELPVPTQSFNNLEMGLASSVRPTRDTKKTSTEDLPLRSSSAETAMATSLPSASYLFGSKGVSTATPAVPFRSAVAVSTASVVFDLSTASSFSTPKMGLASSVTSTTDTKGKSTEDLPLPSSSASTVMATSGSSAPFLLGSKTVSTATPAVSFGSAVTVSTASEVTELPLPTSSFSSPKKGLASSVRSTTDTKGTSTEDLPLSSSSASTVMASSQSSAALFGSKTVSTATPAVSFGSSVDVSTTSEIAELPVPTSSFSTPKMSLKASAGLETATCQPPLPSSSEGSSPLSSSEKNGTEAIPTNNALTSVSSSMLSGAYPQPHLPRQKVSTGTDTASCQSFQVAGSLPFSSYEKNGMKEVVRAADGLCSISFRNDDYACKLSCVNLEQEIPKGKALTGPDIAACQPPLNSPVTDSSPLSSIEKNGKEEAISAVNDPTSISSSNDDVGKLSSTEPEREFPREKVLTGLDTAACKPPLTSLVTDSSPLSSIEKYVHTQGMSFQEEKHQLTQTQ